jgi:folate-dependent phosphoribosylglycinamide formyltransferase PurN
MVHLVPDEAVDAGPVIGVAEVPIYRTDTLETLTERMHQAEHRLIVQALQRLIVGDEEEVLDDEEDEEENISPGKGDKRRKNTRRRSEAE